MKQKLIIIEGADCTGKTTLAAYVCRVLHAAYYHSSGEKYLHVDMIDYHLHQLYQAQKTLEIAGVSVVMDRLWPSEYCYGRLLRPTVSERYNYRVMFATLTEIAKKSDIHYIFCCADKAHEFQRHSNHVLLPEDYAKVYSEYASLYTELCKQAVHDSTIHRYHVDVNGAKIDNFLKGCKIL